MPLLTQLHRRQIELLRVVNAIASGLRTTG
jgi:hypothetical protein